MLNRRWLQCSSSLRIFLNTSYIQYKNETVESIKSELKKELQKEIYRDVVGDISEEVESFFTNPLRNYRMEYVDVFLEALSMAFEVNIIIFQSNASYCEIINNINVANNFKHTLYFLRTESMHFDPVVPKADDEPFVDELFDKYTHGESYHADGKEIVEQDEDSDDSVRIVEDFNKKETDVLKIVDGNCVPKIEEEDNHDEMLKKFDYTNPRAEDLFHCILVEPSKYEVASPPKQIKSNKMYTIKNVKLGDITSDDNRVYHKTNKNSRKYYVSFTENGCDAYTLHEESGKYFYKVRNSRTYYDKYVSEEDIYLLHRYYRFSKAVPGLKQMVIQVVPLLSKIVNPYFCVVYSLNSNKNVIDVEDVSLSQHGNCKQPSSTSKPYIRTNPKVLSQIDSLLEKSSSPSDVFYKVLDECGGPMQSTSPSNEPRSIEQVNNRKKLTKRKLLPSSSTGQPLTDLDRLIMEQRNPESPVQTVLVSQDNYVAFIYTYKQLRDIELFCCDPDDNNACVLGIDTTFKLCDMWITDTSYRNKRLVSLRYKDHPVYLGPLMLHFTKDEETFRRFLLEMLGANPGLLNLHTIGTDMESAIFNGFHSILIKLFLLLCVRHLQERDEKAIEKLQSKLQTADKYKASNKQNILWDIYGKRTDDVFQQGLADAEDVDEFNAKLMSLKPRWDKLCTGFYNWFVSNRKKEFEQSVIKSARDGTNVRGLYYQNDIESKHAEQKRMQCFKKGTTIDVVNTMKELIKREDQQEVLALYGGDKYVLSSGYKQWFNPKWHNLTDGEKATYLTNFRSSKPSMESTFSKPAHPGQKPGYKHRVRITTPPVITIDRHAHVSAPTLVRVPSTTTTSTTTSTTPSTTPSTTTSTVTSLSFDDPRVKIGKSFVLHFRADLPSTVRKCRGGCGHPITEETKMVIKSHGTSNYYDKKTKELKMTVGSLYIHFNGDCMKSYDDEIYAPDEMFDYRKIILDPKTKSKLTSEDRVELVSLGVLPQNLV